MKKFLVTFDLQSCFGYVTAGGLEVFAEDEAQAIVIVKTIFGDAPITVLRIGAGEIA